MPWPRQLRLSARPALGQFNSFFQNTKQQVQIKIDCSFQAWAVDARHVGCFTGGKAGVKDVENAKECVL